MLYSNEEIQHWFYPDRNCRKNKWGKKKSKEVPFPSTNQIIKHPDIWSDITVNEIPQYMGDLAKNTTCISNLLMIDIFARMI